MITESAANDAERRTAGGQPAAGPVYALLTDGSTAEIRLAAAADSEAVRQMHLAMSPDNLYLRFFSLSPAAADQEARRVCRPPGPGHAALLAWLHGRLAGVASYEQTGIGATAEVAFAVPDDLHRHGIATLLLEHLVALAIRDGVNAFTATTLPENTAMLRVFADAGLPVQRVWAQDEVQLTFPLPAAGAGPDLDSYRDQVASREDQADVASLRYLLEPRSVAVITTGQEAGSAGQAVVRNLVAGGFTGPVYAVNAYGGRIAGLRCLTSASDLPEDIDLAVIAAPGPAVPDLAAACGRRGIRALVVISSGLGAGGADLLAICRRHGIRLAGPGSLGIMIPALSLNATATATAAQAGIAGLVTQSGGMGIALASHLSRLGIGISSFVSAGEKFDVSSNDLLTWWDHDGRTQMAVLYLESFGNPRKFARTARRVGRRMPVLTVIGSGSVAPSDAAGAALSGATAPVITREALFGQAGIIATRTVTELSETAALLACQPLPSGNRVAVVSSTRAGRMLAAAACAEHGLAVARLSGPTLRRLRRLLPGGAEAGGPVDTTLAVTPAVFRACLEQVAADEAVDAVVAVIVPTATWNPDDLAMGAALPKPFAMVRLDQAESVRILPAPPRPPGQPALALPPRSGVPCYADPQSAVRAVGHAARYQAWSSREPDQPPLLDGIRDTAARELVGRDLGRRPAGGWLAPSQAAALLSCYGLTVSPVREPGVKAELTVSVRQESVFGPLIALGLSGASAGLLSDSTARLAPLNHADTIEMIRELQAAPILLGTRGDRAVDTAALGDLLLRVSRLADDVPEVAELDLGPVLSSPGGARITAARVRVHPAPHTDPFLRQLR